MGDLLPLLIIFGSGALVALGFIFSPMGRATAERIRRGTGSAPDPQLYEELDQLRHDVAELQERVDFAERMLAKGREAGQLEK